MLTKALNEIHNRPRIISLLVAGLSLLLLCRLKGIAQAQPAPWKSERGYENGIPIDMPRKSVPSRSRGFGLRGRVMAGNSGSFRTPQTQVSGSSELPIAGFLSPSGFGSGRSAAVSTHRAANVSGGWSAKALCGRTWL